MRKITEKVETTLKALQEKQASDIITLQLIGITAIADYMVICTGENPPQIKALAENVEAKLKQLGKRPRSMQGLANAKWVLIDCGDVLVNIFDNEYRRFYELEKLWLDAPRIDVTEETLQHQNQAKEVADV
ncbi:MAG: ribosome silencing factor [Nitrospirae bacterium]|nr:ribosome silencing factor [Nitrospirota bacterium]